ncbi:hypothetical protein JCM6882_006517 [Rhodosporidiobolus microsporus]
MSAPPNAQSSPPGPPDLERHLQEGALHLCSAYQRLLDSPYPLTVSPNALSNVTTTHYTPYQPASLSSLSPFVPLPAAPRNHSGHLSSAIESALWTGDLPSLGLGEGAPASEAAAVPSTLPTFPGWSSALTHPPAPFSPLSSSALTVGQTLAAVPPAPPSSGPAPKQTALPAAGTLAARGGSAGGFNTDHLVGAPTGMQSRVKPFIQKLSHLLSRPDVYADCLSWDSAGTAFVIHHCKRLHSDVLPRMFSHSNSASFTRQLNVSSFLSSYTAPLHLLCPSRSLSSSPLSMASGATELTARVDLADLQGYSGWIHDGFRKGDKASLHLLVPRPSRARLAAKEEKTQLKMGRESRSRKRQHRGSSEEDEEGAEAEEAEEAQAAPPLDGRRDSEASASSNSGSSLLTPTSPPSAFTPFYLQNDGGHSCFDPVWASK